MKEVAVVSSKLGWNVGVRKGGEWGQECGTSPPPRRHLVGGRQRAAGRKDPIPVRECEGELLRP